MRTIFVSPDFPLNRRMRKAVRRGKLQVVREGEKRLSLGGGMPVESRRAFRTHSSPLVCMADNDAESGGGQTDKFGRVYTLAELLDGDVRMSLPFYQREYTWQQKNHDELWEDILGVKARSNGGLHHHYMGSVTLENTPDAPRSYRIIDGQQRLVSLCLMAGACVRKLRGLASKPKGEESQARADEIARMFLVNGNDARDGENMKVRLLNLEGHNDHDYFREMTLGNGPIANLPDPQNPTQKNLRNALSRFHRRFGALQDEDHFDFIRTHAGRGLLFAPIALGEEFKEQGHRVYATLNFRGLQLTDAHVVKAHLLAEVSRDELGDCTKQWADLLKKIGEKEMVGFLRHAFRARFGMGERELSDAIKGEVSESDESKIKVMDYLGDLHKKADFFVKLRNPDQWRGEDSSHIRFLKEFNIKTPTPLLMSSHEQFSAEDFSRVLCLCEVVMFRRSMARQQAGPMDNFARDTALEIHNGKIRNYADLRRHFDAYDILDLYPGDNVFGDGILTNFPKAIAQRVHCLARLEQFLSDGAYPHILPAHVVPLLSKVDLRDLNLAAVLLGNVANFVLWEREVQDPFVTMPYERRVGVLQDSKYNFSQKTANKWPHKTAGGLKGRGEWIKSLAVQIWNLDKCSG